MFSKIVLIIKGKVYLIVGSYLSRQIITRSGNLWRKGAAFIEILPENVRPAAPRPVNP